MQYWIERFGEEYSTLKARVLRTLCDATGPDKALTTQYGGIAAISLFGSKAIDAFLLPVVPSYWQKWDKELAAATDIEHRTELLMCQQAVLVCTIGLFSLDLNIDFQLLLSCNLTKVLILRCRTHWEYFFVESTVSNRLHASPGESWRKRLETSLCH